MMSESELYQHAPQPTSLANLQTVAQARAQLEARLIGIHNDLQLTQTIGLLFVKRQEDLKSCFDQLQELKDLESPAHRQHHGSDTDSAFGSESLAQQPLPESLREQLALIDKEFQEGQNGILGLKGLIDAQLVSNHKKKKNSRLSVLFSCVVDRQKPLSSFVHTSFITPQTLPIIRSSIIYHLQSARLGVTHVLFSGCQYSSRKSKSEREKKK